MQGPRITIGGNDGKTPAGRFGSCMALVIGLLAGVSVLGIWYFTSSDGIEALEDSFYLQFNGEKTSGMVTDVETFSDGDPVMPSTSYKLLVSYEVDGQTYVVKSRSFFKGSDRIGESMPVIYDPEKPGRALINTFSERWLDPFIEASP